MRYRWVVPIEQLGDLVKRVTLLPALPHQRLLALRVNESEVFASTATLRCSDCSAHSVLQRPVAPTTLGGHSISARRAIVGSIGSSRYRAFSQIPVHSIFPD